MTPAHAATPSPVQEKPPAEEPPAEEPPVAQPPDEGETIPETGADLGTAATLGAALAATGAAMYAASRKSDADDPGGVRGA